MKIDSFQGTYRFLSNFWPAPIEYEGILYPTVEHAYQAAKSTCPFERKQISELKTPGEAKRAGKTVKLRDDWDNVKDDVMEKLVTLKFQITSLKKLLIATGNAELVEGNNWNDTYWGRCNGIGKNKLGIILMKVRSALVSSKEKE